MQPVEDVYGLGRQWSVIRTGKHLACGKLIGVLGPGKAWAHARSKQTPHCNFPPLKRHLHTSHTAIQCNSDFKAFENAPLTNLPDVCSTMITRGGWNEIRGRYPKQFCPSFFSAQICSLAHQRVSVINAGAMEKAGLSITFFAEALKFVKKSDKRMADGWLPRGSGFKTQTCDHLLQPCPLWKLLARIFSAKPASKKSFQMGNFSRVLIFELLLVKWMWIWYLAANALEPPSPLLSWLSISREVFSKQPNAQLSGRYNLIHMLIQT